MIFCSIASGSSGNCIYVGNEDTHILVDAGISAKRIEEGLNEIGVDPNVIDAVFVTHEHSDHIQGLGVFTGKHNNLIYGTVETICAARKCKSNLIKIPEERMRYVKPDEKFKVGSIDVVPFSVSHDAANPVAYTFFCSGKKIGMATDLGIYTEYTIEHLIDSDIIYLESNHDVNMLEVGPYPYYLKQRILGERGHLSNESAAMLLNKVYSGKLKHILLAHLSKENNIPELAYETVKAEFLCKIESNDKPTLVVAPRDGLSEKYTI